MKNIFFIILFGLSLNVFANAQSSITQMPKYKFNHSFIQEKNYNFDRSRVELLYKTTKYNSPLYFYKNQFRVSIADGIKFWIVYNDFSLIQKASENKISKYKTSISGTFRFRLPW